MGEGSFCFDEAGDKEEIAMGNNAKKDVADLNWKWPKGMKPSGRPIEEILNDARQEFLEKEGCLYTEEECAVIVDEIRKELREKGETQ